MHREAITIPRHLKARRVLEELVDVRVAQLPITAHVREVVAAVLVKDCAAECGGLITGWIS